MTRSEIAGILRVILPLVAGYAAGRGKDLSALTDPALIEAGSVLLATACALWSVKSKRSPHESSSEVSRSRVLPPSPPPPAA